MQSKINHWAVWLIVLIGQLVPLGWYMMFQKPWMEYSNLTEDFIQANQTVAPFAASIVASIIFAYTLAIVFQKMNIESAPQGFVYAILMGFAFTHLPVLIHGLFAFRPYPLAWIDGGANLVIWALAGLILGGWRKY